MSVIAKVRILGKMWLWSRHQYPPMRKSKVTALSTSERVVTGRRPSPAADIHSQGYVMPLMLARTAAVQGFEASNRLSEGDNQVSSNGQIQGQLQQEQHPAEAAFLQACRILDALDADAAQLEDTLMRSAAAGDTAAFKSALTHYKTEDTQRLMAWEHWSRTLVQLLESGCLSPDAQERCTRALAEQTEVFSQHVEDHIRNQDLMREIVLSAASAADNAAAYLRALAREGREEDKGQ